MLTTTTTPSVTPAPHAVWDAAIRASGQGEKQTNPSSHHHCIIPLRTGEYLNLPRRGYFHRMGERKRGEKPDCRAWVTSLFGGCPFDHWLEFEVKEAPRRRPPRLGSPSQGLGTLKPTSVPLPGTQPRCRDAAMPSTEHCGCTIHWHTFASPEMEESINPTRHSCKPHPMHTRGLIAPSSFSFPPPRAGMMVTPSLHQRRIPSSGPWAGRTPRGGRKPGSCRHPRISAQVSDPDSPGRKRGKWRQVR